MQQERNPLDVAWAAGLFEGEGNFTLRAKTSAEAMLGMTDEDVVRRFAVAVGFGSVHREERKAPHRTLFRWSAANAQDARALIAMFLPYFGGRRRQRALAVLEYTKDCPGLRRERTACRKNHPYDENTYVVPGTNNRKCRICQQEQDLAYRQANREKLRLRAAAWRAAHPDDARASRRASYHRKKE